MGFQKSPPTPRGYFTVAEVARGLDCDQRSVRELAQRGRIQAVKQEIEGPPHRSRWLIVSRSFAAYYKQRSVRGPRKVQR